MCQKFIDLQMSFAECLRRVDDRWELIWPESESVFGTVVEVAVPVASQIFGCCGVDGPMDVAVKKFLSEAAAQAGELLTALKDWGENVNAFMKTPRWKTPLGLPSQGVHEAWALYVKCAQTSGWAAVPWSKFGAPAFDQINTEIQLVDTYWHLASDRKAPMMIEEVIAMHDMWMYGLSFPDHRGIVYHTWAFPCKQDCIEYLGFYLRDAWDILMAEPVGDTAKPGWTKDVMTHAMRISRIFGKQSPPSAVVEQRERSLKICKWLDEKVAIYDTICSPPSRLYNSLTTASLRDAIIVLERYFSPDHKLCDITALAELAKDTTNFTQAYLPQAKKAITHIQVVLEETFKFKHMFDTRVYAHVDRTKSALLIRVNIFNGTLAVCNQMSGAVEDGKTISDQNEATAFKTNVDRLKLPKDSPLRQIAEALGVLELVRTSFPKLLNWL